MSSLVEIALCGEGPTDIAIARALVRVGGGVPGRDLLGRRRGKAELDRRLPGLAAGALFRPTLVLRDLDADAPCAGDLVAALVPTYQPGLCLRIAVRSAEAWLLADTAAFAEVFGLKVGQMPRDPETLEKPKSLIWQRCRKSRIREYRSATEAAELEPQRLGLWLSNFVNDHWSPTRAAESGAAPSLARALRRVRELCRPSP